MSPKARVQKRLYYKIGEACKALDIQPYVLRYWETEFPALSPNKSRSGQRVYSEKELGVILRIKELLYIEGYTIAGAKKKLETELASGLLPREVGEGEEPQAAEGGGGEAGEAGGAQAEAAQTAAPPAPEPASPAPRRGRSSGRGAAVPAGQQSLLLDSQAAERTESMRQGIRQALDEARELLALLDSKSLSRR
jgi:DNA-binding transcriptional MerR regulator